MLNAQSDALVNQYRIAYDRFINLASPDTSAPPLFTLGRPNAIPVDAATYQAALERGRTGQNHIVAGDAASAELTAESSSNGLPSGPVSLGLLGAVIGLAVGIGIATLRARFDNKLRARPDFEEAFALPILGGVPILARDEQARHMLSVIEKPYSPGAEVFRSVRSALLLLGTDNPDREGALVVMVASAQPKEGKSATCANLAAAFAESGRSVLAINCDYRRATLHHYFGLSNDGGRILATDVHGLSVVTNVPNTKVSPGRVAAQQRTFIEAQRANYDVILLDTAPLLSTSDPIDIVPTADFVLLVGRPGYTERDHARQTMELLDRHRVTVAGLLMTAVDPVGSDYYYYYSAYSSYASVTFPAEAERTDSCGRPRSHVKPCRQPRPPTRRDVAASTRRGCAGGYRNRLLMTADLDPETTQTPSRRTIIRRAAAAGVVAWTAPVIVDSLASPAAAATLTGCFRAEFEFIGLSGGCGTYARVTAKNGEGCIAAFAWNNVPEYTETITLTTESFGVGNCRYTIEIDASSGCTIDSRSSARQDMGNLCAAGTLTAGCHSKIIEPSFTPGRFKVLISCGGTLLHRRRRLHHLMA